MNTEYLSDLPEWDDQYDLDEGEHWKPNATHTMCKALYKQWQEVMFVLKGILMQVLEGGTDDMQGMEQDMAQMLMTDACVIGAKIRSSEAGDIYILRMENAAIIRQLAQSIASRLLLFEDESVDPVHVRVVRNEINKFRLLFIVWVNTFEKDEFKDDWGLFV
jgi:hypothetical protein